MPPLGAPKSHRGGLHEVKLLVFDIYPSMSGLGQGARIWGGGGLRCPYLLYKKTPVLDYDVTTMLGSNKMT